MVLPGSLPFLRTSTKPIFRAIASGAANKNPRDSIPTNKSACNGLRRSVNWRTQ